MFARGSKDMRALALLHRLIARFSLDRRGNAFRHSSRSLPSSRLFHFLFSFPFDPSLFEFYYREHGNIARIT